MKLLNKLAALSVFFIGLAAPTIAQAATLSLDPPSGTFNRGCSFALNINVDAGSTQNGIDGVDGILLFTPTQFNALSISNGSIFPDYPGNVVDNNSNPAKVSVSGLASVSSAFKGSGTLATVNFQVPANATLGAATINFDFDPNQKDKTTDSNVVERQTVIDILSSVTNGNYTIGTGACTNPGATTTGTTTTTSSGTSGTFAGSKPVGAVGPGFVGSSASDSSLTTLAPGGRVPGAIEPTIIMSIAGVIFVVLGIIGIAIL